MRPGPGRGGVYMPTRLPPRLERRAAPLGAHDVAGARPSGARSRGRETKRARASSWTRGLSEGNARHEPTFPIVVSIIGPGDLTTEFEMGSGVTPRVWAPGKERGTGVPWAGIRSERLVRASVSVRTREGPHAGWTRFRPVAGRLA